MRSSRVATALRPTAAWRRRRTTSSSASMPRSMSWPQTRPAPPATTPATPASTAPHCAACGTHACAPRASSATSLRPSRRMRTRRRWRYFPACCRSWTRRGTRAGGWSWRCAGCLRGTSSTWAPPPPRSCSRARGRRSRPRAASWPAGHGLWTTWTHCSCACGARRTTRRSSLWITLAAMSCWALCRWRGSSSSGAPPSSLPPTRSPRSTTSLRRSSRR
mmetsp:Transcript_21814/g.54987  ORF Transcript_21814/g.54987 Transcript_21814/m.54987 type:complete len:219 (-) Transcript_21814:262-918(-)